MEYGELRMLRGILRGFDTSRRTGNGTKSGHFDRVSGRRCCVTLSVL